MNIKDSPPNGWVTRTGRKEDSDVSIPRSDVSSPEDGACVVETG